MEKMPALKKWEERVYYSAGMKEYILVFSGNDKSGRNYFYTGLISKIVDCSGYPLKTYYSAEYKLFTDGKNFKLKPVTASERFKTLKEAKVWVEEAYRTQWAKDHEERRTA